MPRVMGGGKSTYLLVSGIKVSRRVKLAENVELILISEETPPRPYLAKLDLLDQQFALLLLPWVQCQLRVSGQGKRDVATRAWNSLWDVLLLSAIYTIPVTCGLQSTCAFERFTERSRLNVIDYRLFGPLDVDGLLLDENDCVWLESYFGCAQDLLSDYRFQNAVHCLATYRWHTLPRAQLALLWAGIEGLFGVDSEIAFRVSLYTAKFLAPDDAEDQRTIFNTVKRLYGVRSKAVHGGRLKGDPRDSVRESMQLLGRLVRTCIERGQLPVLEGLAP